MLVRLEEQGKVVTPGNVAYYVILHSKSGRRSTGSSRVDVMASQTQLCGISAVHSFEEEIGLNEEFDGPCTLGELLSNTGDDPSMQAARNLDWEAVSGRRTDKTSPADARRPGGWERCCKVPAEEEGVATTEIRSSSKGDLAFNLKEQMGQDILADALRPPAWKASLMVERERAACRH